MPDKIIGVWGPPFDGLPLEIWYMGDPIKRMCLMEAWYERKREVRDV